MLGLDNPIHIAFLLVLLLLVFGAKRLPELGRSLGAGMRGFKESITGQDVGPQLEAGEVPAPATVASPERGLWLPCRSRHGIDPAARPREGLPCADRPLPSRSCSSPCGSEPAPLVPGLTLRAPRTG